MLKFNGGEIVDIDYLLFLQGLRESLGEDSIKFFELVSFIPKSPLSVLIPGILFWCINKRAGLLLMFVATLGQVINQLVKNTFCVYRPWVFNEDLLPVEKDMLKASSYAFPSAHTVMTTAIYGGLAYFYRKKFPALIIPCVIIILLVALSRNFLGVHTPQDVLFAMLETFILIFLADKFLFWLEWNKSFSTLAFIAGIIFCAIAASYFMLKNYPVDYLHGKIIVETFQAQLDSVDKVACFAGFLIGAFLENKFVNFKVNVSTSTKIYRAVIGCIVGGAMFAILYLIKMTDIEILYEFCKGFIPFISVIFLAPLTFTYMEKKFYL